MTEGEEGGVSSKSKTKLVTAYTFNNTKLQFRLLVIDTPGKALFCGQNRKNY